MNYVKSMKKSYFYKETFTFKYIFLGSPLRAWRLRDLILYLTAFDSIENFVIYVSAIIPVEP
jgi:cellulose synthase/poly-beta-1,6-N-acetylglucosamine synthase-like glycosyltransferase